MDRVESEAVKEPLNAKILRLDTLANSSLHNKDLWIEMGFEEPSACGPVSRKRRIIANFAVVFKPGLVRKTRLQGVEVCGWTYQTRDQRKDLAFKCCVLEEDRCLSRVDKNYLRWEFADTVEGPENIHLYDC